MKLKTLLLSFAALVLCANAFAATPSDESLERLYQVQKMDTLLDQTFQSVEGIVLSDPKIQNFFEKCAGRQTSAAGSSLKEYTTQLIAAINTPQVRAQLHKATLDGIKTVYTQEEVNALIDFYGTTVGQSILDKMPRYLEATMGPMINIINEKYEKSGYNKDLTQEIQRIMCGGKNPDQVCTRQAKKTARRK